MKEVDLSNPDVVRYVVKRFGLRMNKKLGQNFLIRHAVVDDIADAAEIGAIRSWKSGRASAP